MVLMVVVFPAPLGPRKARISPGAIARDRWFTATRSPYLRVSCSAARQRGGVNQWRQGRRLSATITVRARRWRAPHGVAQGACAVCVRVQSPVAAPGAHWRQGSGVYGHAPCEEPQNPCESRRARRPAPPNATPAWIQCPPAGAPRAVRWQQYKAATLPRAAHQIHAAVHTVLHRRRHEDVLAGVWPGVSDAATARLREASFRFPRAVPVRAISPRDARVRLEL